MNLKLSASNLKSGALKITGSKSESNRLLILQALYPDLRIDNLSNSDDTDVLQTALASDESVLDIHHAGTSMRFLTTYLALKPGFEGVLTGSERMQQRPIGVLVDALRQLGAEISYEKEQGYPPLRISGVKPTGNRVRIAANISSQYLSSLLLTGSSLDSGLILELEGKLTSVPYLQMTLTLLEALGAETRLTDAEVYVGPITALKTKDFTVESDWSSASYFYSLMALGQADSIKLSSYKPDSLQGDSGLVNLFEPLGVQSAFNADEVSLTLTKSAVDLPQIYSADLADTPDLAQTIAVCCFGLGIGCELSGLHTLKIKETDRLQALKNELEKFGAQVNITDDHLSLAPSQGIKSGVSVATYQDHRMAMAFAPLALKTDLVIEEAGVVSKSYPEFWEDLKTLGFQIENQR
ncbi:3-phosphoshikimate 1-carboxyvinyltransferase [Gilvibacter sediminis]|uniref:3-phosphoshikimate 1-carboxyvinyltransferase n=1 Tax=Gilvibacter sediminis TaxID=379071 RepID=UPI002350C73D|nr:3-phosphoshikimate 1-carboxyvinyltransferase [Gilvibacter sediminis]MDC7998670.1 3-phosphoshikimate 1-carboxyvinyltransferase [Gilvibacter sediminis]